MGVFQNYPTAPPKPCELHIEKAATRCENMPTGCKPCRSCRSVRPLEYNMHCQFPNPNSEIKGPSIQSTVATKRKSRGPLRAYPRGWYHRQTPKSHRMVHASKPKIRGLLVLVFVKTGKLVCLVKAGSQESMPKNMISVLSSRVSPAQTPAMPYRNQLFPVHFGETCAENLTQARRRSTQNKY